MLWIKHLTKIKDPLWDCIYLIKNYHIIKWISNTREGEKNEQYHGLKHEFNYHDVVDILIRQLPDRVVIDIELVYYRIEHLFWNYNQALIDLGSDEESLVQSSAADPSV